MLSNTSGVQNPVTSEIKYAVLRSMPGGRRAEVTITICFLVFGKGRGHKVANRSCNECRRRRLVVRLVGRYKVFVSEAAGHGLAGRADW